MTERTHKITLALSNFGHSAACLTLYLIALCILGSAIWGIICDFRSATYSVYNLLDEVALIVFSIAVIDISKYLLIEEVLGKDHSAKMTGEARDSLTKFAMIIGSALSLEGLVLTIEVAKQDVTKILFPIGLLFAATVYIVGIGVYYKLSTGSER